jgi:transposase
MKYTKEQRLDIGRRIYDGEISKYEAAEQYDISYQTALDYMRLYRNENHLPPKCGIVEEEI